MAKKKPAPRRSSRPRSTSRAPSRARAPSHNGGAQNMLAQRSGGAQPSPQSPAPSTQPPAPSPSRGGAQGPQMPEQQPASGGLTKGQKAAAGIAVVAVLAAAAVAFWPSSADAATQPPGPGGTPPPTGGGGGGGGGGATQRPGTTQQGQYQGPPVGSNIVPGSTSVAQVQTALVKARIVYQNRPYTQQDVDGRADNDTANAIRVYQTRYGLPVTGQINDRLRADMLSRGFLINPGTSAPIIDMGTVRF